MASSVSIPSAYALPRYTVWLARIVAAGLVVAGVLEAFSSESYRGVAAVIFFAGAVLIAAGLFAFTRTSPWVAFALVFVGAAITGGMFWWTIGVPIVAIALIVLFALGARRASVAKRQARRTSEALSPAGLV
jgi:formate-dependent nitrite reductase membrane component NrfD